MENFKRLTASVLMASVLFGICSCARSIEDPVKEAAESLGRDIADRDYQEILEQVTVGARNLERKMTFDSDDENQNIAKELISDTMEFEVDESSYSGDKESGSIDITFSYVDYSSLEGEFFVDTDSFSDALSSCSDRIEETLTFEFVKKDDKILCNNIYVADVLFPYADVDFNFALPLAEYAGDAVFTNANWRVGEYTYDNEPEEIAGHVSVEGDGQLLTWEYYWQITDEDGAVICVSEGTDIVECPTELEFSYPYSSDLFPNGEYTVTIFDTDGEILKEVTFRVEIVTGGWDSTAIDPNNVLTDLFCYPEDGIVYIPDTDIVIDLPDEIVCLSPQEVVDTLGSSLSGYDKPLVFLSGDLVTGMEVVECEYWGDFGYDSPEAETSFRETMDDLEQSYLSYGYDAQLEYSEYTVDGRTFITASLSVDLEAFQFEGYYMLIGDEDTCYRLIISSFDPDFASRVVTGISIT